jgi:electron transport complex protein RnfG
MNLKEIVKISVNLLIIYAAGGLLLAAVYATTSPVIFQKAKIEKEQALKALMPEADKIEKLGDWHPHEKHGEYYVAKKGGKDIGYIVETFGKGYSSYIDILVAVDTNFAVEKINILHHAETPGLGDEIETAWFQNQFKGKTLDHLKVIKGETATDIQAISGATISSRAVTEDGVKKGVEFLEKALSGEVKDEHKE